MDEQKKLASETEVHNGGPTIVRAESESDSLEAQSGAGQRAGAKARVEKYKESQPQTIQAQTTSSRAADADKIDDEPIPKFPRVVIGLIWTLLLTYPIYQFFQMQGSGASLMLHLPMQIFWTMCVYRLLQISDRMAGKITKDLPIALLSIVTFILAPSFPAPVLATRFFDPFFILWAVSQCVAPWMLGKMIDAGARVKQGNTSIKLTVLGNWYLLMGVLAPQVLNSDVLFNALWFLSQFAWIVYAIQLLQEKLSKAEQGSRQSGSNDQVRQKAFISGEEIELRYRALAGLQRWMAQRFNAQGMKQGLKQFFMWVLGPIVVIVGVYMTREAWQNVTLAPSIANDSSALAASSCGSVQLYMLSLITFLLLSMLAALVKYRSFPTHLLLSSEGMRWEWKHNSSKKGKKGKLNLWSDLVHIGMKRPKGETSTLHDALVFNYVKGKPLELKLDAFDSYEDKEWILKALKSWAPGASRDAAVMQCLQPPADYSYTELWLQALSAPPQRERLKPLVPGIKLKQGKYEVIRSIGVGGQGQAYLATDTISGQQLVLKEFILPVYVDITVRKSALEQFENEARILRQLDNPQIVKLDDYFVEDHRAYLVLEHIDGASLRKLVESQGALPEALVRELAEQMCSILSYLHGLEPAVVHRDFTPDNLILNTNGTLKLIDFNVAQQQESTTSGTVVGKHAYLPPEQFRGMPTAQSDIYAMGATLYFLLTGQDPEPISSAHPSKTNASVSASMNSLVAKATAMKLADRYQKIENLNDDLMAAATPIKGV